MVAYCCHFVVVLAVLALHQEVYYLTIMPEEMGYGCRIGRPAIVGLVSCWRQFWSIAWFLGIVAAIAMAFSPFDVMLSLVWHGLFILVVIKDGSSSPMWLWS